MNRDPLLSDDVTTPTMEQNDVFGDEHEVDEFDMVADGFRPGNDMRMAQEFRNQGLDGQGEEGADHGGDATVQTVSAHYSSRPVTPTAPSRNSIRKSRDFSLQPNPFSSPEDGDHERVVGGLQFEPDSYGVRRSVSTTSSRMFAQTNSPRFGMSGPSHPYGMYQQGTMPRSPSTATASTIRPLDRRLSALPQGPQHPYSMYPQGVDEDLYDEDGDEQQPLQSNPIPVGFPGLAQNYVRRLGPDGEEQDIIGDDGHTEQLPPYSRYPDEGPEKMPLLMPTALHSRAPVAGTDPTMPLMHTLLQPSSAPQSMTDTSQLSNRNDSLGSMEHLRSGSGSVDGAITSLPKNWKAASWKEKANIKFCGIPFWCYVLALVMISLIAAVLGIVIGGFITNHSRNSNNSKNGPTVTFTTSLFDASLIASPTSKAPCAGTFALSLGAPQQTQSQCLVLPEQRPAWNCDIVPNAEIAIAVSTGSSGTQDGANIFYAAEIQIGYGAQASYMNTTLSPFLTVEDNNDVKAGPAFFFTATYDKVVVLPEAAIDVRTGRFNKRDYVYNPHYLDHGWYNPGIWPLRNQVAQPSDKPWFCVWNDTLLEGFIYVNHESNWTNTPTTHYTPVYPTPSSHSRAISSISTTNAPSNTYLSPTTKPNYATMGSNSPSVPTTAPVKQSGGGYINDDDDDGYYKDHYKRGAGPATTNPSVEWKYLPVYPYLVKLEERRLPTNSIPPYCQQYQILDNGHANCATNQYGGPIIVTLQEQDPSFGAYRSAGLGEVAAGKVRVRRHDGLEMVPNGCHCEWISGGIMPGQGGLL